jgi:hypothetical protein
MRRFVRWLLSIVRKEPAYQPVKHRKPLYDPAFVMESFRPGETFDPLSATLKES